MKVRNIAPFQSWLQDLKSGKLINHQPKRKSGNAKWFVLQRIVEGNPLSQKGAFE